MQQAYNIAKTFILLTALLLLAMPRYVHAQTQNTGAAPYYDSKHAYRVSIDDAVNKRIWLITDGTTSHTILNTITPVPLPVWAGIYDTGAGAGQAGVGFHGVSITFDRTVFTTSDWNLEYYEYENHGAGFECVAARSFPISIVENTFYLTLAADVTSYCNGESGEVHAYTKLDDPGEVFETAVTYTVSMSKHPDYDPSYWTFDANFSQSITSINVSTTDGTANVSELTAGTDYNIEITPSAANADAVNVSITVTYDNNVLADVTNSITVSNGQAVVEAPPAPDAITEDNITTYPVGNAGDRIQAITISKLPATADIGHGEFETALTAQNPLLLSEHRYVVVMENVANTATWWIQNAAGTVTLVPDNDYNISTNQSATADTAYIDFIDETVPTGAYVIYFRETDATTGCSTIRPYDITLHGPFDVDIAADLATSCPEVSGTINNDYTTATSTTLNYTVTLNTADYVNNWSFVVTVTSDVGFAAGDVDVAAAGIAVSAGASYAEGANKYTGTVSVTGGTTEVTVSVTYTGIYVNEHDMTVTLTGITGSFGEDDADASDAATNTLYRMPQPLTLAGVD